VEFSNKNDANVATKALLFPPHTPKHKHQYNGHHLNYSIAHLWTQPYMLLFTKENYVSPATFKVFYFLLQKTSTI